MGLLDIASRRLIHPLWAPRECPTAGRDRAANCSPAIRSARSHSPARRAALRRMLHHAVATVPYYRDLFQHLRIAPDGIATEADLVKLPVLSKADVRANGRKLLSTAFRGRELTRKTTSGSTGVPLEIHLDPGGLAWKRACTLRADEWSGWTRGQHVAKVWGNPEYRQSGMKGRLRNAVYDRTVYLDTLRMSPEMVAQFARMLARTKPELIFGHAHSVFLLAETIRRLDVTAIGREALSPRRWCCTIFSGAASRTSSAARSRIATVAKK